MRGERKMPNKWWTRRNGEWTKATRAVDDNEHQLAIPFSELNWSKGGQENRAVVKTLKGPCPAPKSIDHAVNDLQLAVDVRYRLYIFPLPHRGHMPAVLPAADENKAEVAIG